MKRINNHQVTLKSQALLVALKLALRRQESPSYAELAKALGRLPPKSTQVLGA
jgi:hypothetical protein